MTRLLLPASLVAGAAGVYAWTRPPAPPPQKQAMGQSQGATCAIPPRLELPDVEPPRPEEIVKSPVIGYVVALSWSPQFCKDKKGNQKHAIQCSGAAPFGFILHGLWPQGAGGNHPAWCASAGQLSADEVRTNFCMTPSPQLMQHEWAKHGTCQWRDASAYFKAARDQFARFKAPDMDGLSRRGVEVEGFKAALNRANPSIPVSSFAVQANQGGWLKEVQICLDTRFRPEPCSGGRRERKGQALKIWRAEK